MPRTMNPEPTSEAAIFARVWLADGRMTPTLARHVLKLGFTDADRTRMRELAERHREGVSTEVEVAELDNFVKVGDTIALLQSAARRLLGSTVGKRSRHA